MQIRLISSNLPWGSYAARKELKRTRFAEHPTYINEDQASSRRGAKASSHSNFYKPNERHQAIVQRVKTPMPGQVGEGKGLNCLENGSLLLQKGPNSVLKKKSSTLLNPSDYGTEVSACPQWAMTLFQSKWFHSDAG